MIRKLKGLYRELAHDESLEMPIRLFRLFCLVVTVLTLFIILPVNLLQNLPILVNIGDVLLGLFALFCFWECTRGRYHQSLFLIVMVLLMEPIWFLNSGTNGSITFYFLAIMIYPMVMFRGRKSWTLTVCMIFNICALLAIDYFLPSLAVPFRGPSDRVLDLISGVFCSSLGLVMIVWVVISNYDRERERTDKYARDLAEAHNRIERTLAAIPDMMFETDVKGRIYDYYAPAAEALYAQPEAFLGKLVKDVLPPAAADVILKALAQAATEGLHRGATYALDLPGGRRWFEISIAAKPGDSAPDTRLVGLVRDITERKQTEEALREREETFRLAMDATNDALWDWNMVTNEVYRNPRHATMLGYEPQDFSSSQDEWEKRIHPDDKKRVFDCLTAHLKKEAPSFAVEYRLKTKSGDYLWVLGRGKVVAFDNDGKPLRMIGTNVDITERKQAEEKLSYITKAVESTSEAIGISDSRGRHFYQNKALSALFEYATAEELQAAGGGMAVVKDPEVAKEMYNNIMHSKPWAGELEMVTKSGRVFPAYERADAITNPEGNIIGLIGIITDISERKRAENLVRGSEAKYRTLVEMTGTGYLIIDSQGRVLDANQEYVRLSGHGALSEILGRSVIEWTAGAGKQRNAEAVAQCAKDGFIRNFVTEYVDAKGRATFVEINATVEGKGELLRIVSLCRDITERKKIEEALRASEEVSRATFEQAAVGIAHVGTDGRWLQVNDKLCAIVGYPRDELMMITSLEITHPDDLDTDLDYMHQVLSGAIKTYSMEKRYFRKDQSVVWVNLTVALVRTGDGEPRHFVSVVEDITERKNAVEELKRLRLHLWHADRVAQTTAVTASLAHELNQPLAAILTNAEVGLRYMAAANPDLREIREIFADIIRDDERAGAVVSGLRDLLRQQETRSEKFDLADTIRGMTELLHSEMLDKQVQLYFYLEPSSPVLANKAQVQQVILNILMNAIEAMQSQPAGQRRLELTIRHIDESEVLVAFCDSGPGIPEDVREKIFEAFWTTKQDGLGVGLMISRSIIESHKGRLWFANNADNGVTFYFTLPLIPHPVHIELEANR